MEGGGGRRLNVRSSEAGTSISIIERIETFGKVREGEVVPVSQLAKLFLRIGQASIRRNILSEIALDSTQYLLKAIPIVEMMKTIRTRERARSDSHMHTWEANATK